MEEIVYKYQCPTNRDENTKCFRESCTLCDCSPRPKMIGDPGVVKTSEEKDLVCPHTGVALELVDAWQKEESSPMIFGFRMNENQVRKDRLNRSTKDFKENVFHTLPTQDQKIFARKHDDLKKQVRTTQKKK